MRYFKSGSRYTAVGSEGQFIEVKEFRNMQTIATGNNTVIVDGVINNDEEIEQEEFFNVLYNKLSVLNEQVDLLND
jgi:hypothetical protein